MSYTIGRLRGQLAIVFRDANGKRHRYSLGTANSSQARAIAPAIYAELTKPKGTTVAVLWKAYLEDRRGRAITDTMASTWKALEGRFALLCAESITTADCKNYIADRRASGRRDWTIYTELSHLRTVLNWAKKRGLLVHAPYITRPPEPRVEKQRLTREGLRRLVEAAHLPHVKLYITLLYCTAARTSALVGLTWDRVDLAIGRIDLRDPTIERPHKGRAIVPINETAKTALLEAHRGAISNFVIEWAGRSVKKVRTGLRTAAKRAGLVAVTPHMLRHTAATHMAESGVPMEEIAQYLGHSNVQTTRKIYARFSPDYLAGAAKALEL